MFFHFTPGTTPTEPPPANQGSEGPSDKPPVFIQAADGTIIIDDQSLVKTVSIDDGVLSPVELASTRVWIPNVFGPDGQVGAWVPVSQVPGYY